MNSFPDTIDVLYWQRSDAERDRFLHVLDVLINVLALVLHLPSQLTQLFFGDLTFNTSDFYEFLVRLRELTQYATTYIEEPVVISEVVGESVSPPTPTPQNLGPPELWSAASSEFDYVTERTLQNDIPVPPAQPDLVFRTCFYCHSPGHIVRFCPVRANRRCYNCASANHIWANCPTARTLRR